MIRDSLLASTGTGAVLELSFKTKLIRELCEDQGKATQCLGTELAERLTRRVADLIAADTIFDLVAAPPQQGATINQRFIELSPSCRVVFEPAARNAAVDQSGNVNWSKLDRIVITDIGAP